MVLMSKELGRPFKKGHAGRPKGSKNKFKASVEQLSEEFKVSPLQIMYWIMTNDWKKIGLDADMQIIELADGSTKMKPAISVDQMLKAATELAPYFYSQLKAVDVTTKGESLNEITPHTASVIAAYLDSKDAGK